MACSAPKSCLGAVDGQLLDDVDELAAAVVAPARVALGVLVGEDRALRLEHGAADDVLRRDQLEVVLLALRLVADDAIDLRVDAFELGSSPTACGSRCS